MKKSGAFLSCVALLVVASLLCAQELVVVVRRLAPSDPSGISGLQAWYAADTGVSCSGACSDGGGVSAWNDKSSNANNLSVGTGTPVYHTSQINTKPAITFDGFTYFNFATPINLQASTGGTIFLVFHSTDDTNKQHMVGGPINSFSYWLINSGKAHGADKTATAQLAVSTSVPGASWTTTWYQTNVTRNSTTIAFRRSQAPDGTTSIANTISANETVIGHDADSNSARFVGQLAEVLIYNRVLTGGEITTVEAYLFGRYGI